EQYRFGGGGIVTGVDQEVVATTLANLTHPVEVAGGFLDADDVRHLAQALDGFRQHVAGGAAGHVVENLRDIHRPGDGQVVLVQAFLGRLVVVGRYQQAGIRAITLCITGQANRFLGRVGAGPGNHRHATSGGRQDLADHQVVLFKTKRGRLTGGTDCHDAVGALLDVPMDQVPQRLPVDGAVGMHGGNEGYNAAGNFHDSLAVMSAWIQGR